MRALTHSVPQTEELAQRFLAELRPLPGAATVVGLVGDLGSGKTTFTQALARALGLREAITSPTFVIEKVYPVAGGAGFARMVHIDTYRLAKSAELLALGWAELISEPDNLIVVEWADKIADILPASTRKIFFNFIDDHTREITW